MIARNSKLAHAGLELAHASGVFRIAERRAAGTGAILRLEHVRPKSTAAFQPLRHQEITPRFLERMIRALQRWKFEFVSVAEARERAQRPRGNARFVALTFDGAYRDFLNHAYPVLQRYEVPFSLYVPTGFVDNIAQAWWLALEVIVARAPRIVLFMQGEERRFRADSAEQKYQVFDVLHAWMMQLPPAELSAAITDLCSRYDVDLKAVSRDIAMEWSDLLKVAADPHATVGSATVSYPVLANVAAPQALREMKMGRTILEAALGHSCEEFAYPFGATETFSRRDVLLARDAGFASAVSARTGLIVPGGEADVMCLPRIAWEGRPRSLRALRVVLSGLTMRRQRPLPSGAGELAS
ncbi:MAG: polysaccharide deacetylase family protein [Xanthobacteraceae bacterium]|nr:polysaccharide deacetylase family protein [Xanthobacteraceae bacterium]